MRRIFLDIGPLRKFPHFRRLWIGYLFRQIGYQLTATTVIYQVYLITHSNADVGLVALAQVAPAVVTPMIGGAIADAIDRRKLLVVTALLFAVSTTGLALNASSHHPMLWPIYVCAVITQGLNGVDSPTRTAVTVTLVDRESILLANMLRQILAQTSQIVGPGLAGILIAAFSHHLPYVYWIDVASTFAALQAVLRLPPLMPGEHGRKFSLGSIAEGFQYLKGRQVLQGCMLSDIVPNVFATPNALFPYMALVHFHGGADAFGLISAARAIGAMAGSLLSGWTHTIARQGRWMLIAIGVWGASLVGFGIAPWLSIGVACIAISGWANALLVLFRTTVLQRAAPNRLRGRLSSIDNMVSSSGPKLGQSDMGLIAGASSPEIALISGGLVCIVGAVLLLKFMPKFAAYDFRYSSENVEDLPETNTHRR